jgi:hypothetical protein
MAHALQNIAPFVPVSWAFAILVNINHEESGKQHAQIFDWVLCFTIGSDATVVGDVCGNAQNWTYGWWQKSGEPQIRRRAKNNQCA